jgi:UDP-N-acetyl-D-glucosamine dehydrogenase
MSDIAVNIGPGYGELPRAWKAMGPGPRVIALDLNDEIVADVEAGRSNIDAVTDNDIMKMMRGRFRTIADPNVIAPARALVIYVPTQLSKNGGPDLSSDRGRRERCHISAASDAGSSRVDDASRHERRRGPPILEASGLVAGADFNLAFLAGAH